MSICETDQQELNNGKNGLFDSEVRIRKNISTVFADTSGIRLRFVVLNLALTYIIFQS